jgi:hypothetical protein
LYVAEYDEFLTVPAISDLENDFIVYLRKMDVSVESLDFWQLSYTEQVENAS